MVVHQSLFPIKGGDCMKIAIYGYSGSGKSTLAKQLAKRYDTALLYMDQVHWLPGWIERTHDAEQAMMKQFLTAHDHWVIDGNYYLLCFDERMKQADQIIFMNFNRFTCLWRAIKRYVYNKGKTRESMSEDCEEKLDFEFVRWILKDGRSKKAKRRNHSVIVTYPDKAIIIKNQKDLDHFMKKL